MKEVLLDTDTILKTHQSNSYTVIVLDGIPQLEEVLK